MQGPPKNSFFKSNKMMNDPNAASEQKAAGECKHYPMDIARNYENVYRKGSLDLFSGDGWYSETLTCICGEKALGGVFESKWFEIGRVGIEDPHVHRWECEFVRYDNNPEMGHCKFCSNYGFLDDSSDDEHDEELLDDEEL